MKTSSLLVVLAVVVLGGFAAAQPIDPDPDGMGVYFDTAGSEYCLVVDDWIPGPGAGPGYIYAYLLVTRPSTNLPYIQGWEAHVEIVTNSYFLAPELTLTPGAFNTGREAGDYMVDAGGAAAIPITGDVVMLASVEIEWLGYEGHASGTIRVQGVADSPLFPDGPGYYSDEAATPAPCQSFFGNWGECAWINGDCGWIWPAPSADERLSWGDVKSLY
jgi:hypothetical protein